MHSVRILYSPINNQSTEMTGGKHEQRLLRVTQEWRPCSLNWKKLIHEARCGQRTEPASGQLSWPGTSQLAALGAGLQWRRRGVLRALYGDHRRNGRPREADEAHTSPVRGRVRSSPNGRRGRACGRRWWRRWPR
jgi:hypothetical protein